MTQDDLQQLVELGVLMHRESPNFRDFTFDKDKVAKLFYLTTVPNSKLFCTYKKDSTGKIYAFLAGAYQERFFSTEKYAQDMAIYILPECRGSSVFVRMVKEFEEWAKARGVKEVCIGHNTGITPEKAPNLYPRLGYEQMGYLFRKEV